MFCRTILQKLLREQDIGLRPVHNWVEGVELPQPKFEPSLIVIYKL